MSRHCATQIIVAVLLSPPLAATVPLPPGAVSISVETIDGEPITTVELKEIHVLHDRTVGRRTARQRRNDRLVRNVKKVYPIALQAERTFAEIETELAKIPRESARREYIAKMERRLEREYTPALRKMTFSQGKILLKLIDRQTDKTSYDILRDLQGKFQASLWQGVATLFEADLKQGYDPESSDIEIEEIVRRIEAGEL